MDYLERKINEIQRQVDGLMLNPILPDHRHNGFDISRVDYVDIDMKMIYIHHTIPGVQSATDTNYGTFWIAPMRCVVTAFSEVHETAGSDAGDVTLQLEKLTDGVAPDSGNTILKSALSLKATANTVQDGAITNTTTSRTLNKGDRLCLKDSGTLTAVSNVSVQVSIKVI